MLNSRQEFRLRISCSPVQTRCGFLDKFRWYNIRVITNYKEYSLNMDEFGESMDASPHQGRIFTQNAAQ